MNQLKWWMTGAITAAASFALGTWISGATPVRAANEDMQFQLHNIEPTNSLLVYSAVQRTIYVYPAPPRDRRTCNVRSSSLSDSRAVSYGGRIATCIHWFHKSIPTSELPERPYNSHMRTTCTGILLLALLTPALPARSGKPSIPVKVVVVTMFEVGADSGDTPGEFQTWVEKEHLDRIFAFPQGGHNLRMNSDGVLGMVTGVGTARAAASVMALGLDPRFDLSNAYWIIAGIAGIDPADGSLGSAVWSEWIVDGDLAHEIDAREIPGDWKSGYVPLRKSVPYEQPRGEDNGRVFHLDPRLVEWAYQLTKNVTLTDTNAMKERRLQFDGANAHRPPFVLKGDELSASTFWHGRLMNEWANSWVKYQTDGKANYVTTAMEDTGTLESLTLLAKAKKVDFSRVLVLRTASNFDQQRAGLTAAESLAETKVLKYSAYLPSLDAAWRVGSVVVHAILAGKVPASAPVSISR